MIIQIAIFPLILSKVDLHSIYPILNKNIQRNLDRSCTQKNLCALMIHAILNHEDMIEDTLIHEIIDFFKTDEYQAIVENFLLFRYFLLYLKYFNKNIKYQQCMQYLQLSIYAISNLGVDDNYFAESYQQYRFYIYKDFKPQQISIAYKDSYLLKDAFPYFVERINALEKGEYHENKI